MTSDLRNERNKVEQNMTNTMKFRIRLNIQTFCMKQTERKTQVNLKLPSLLGNINLNEN